MNTTVRLSPTVTLQLTGVIAEQRSRHREPINLPAYDVLVGSERVGAVHAYTYRIDLTPMARQRRDGAPRKAWMTTPLQGRSHHRVPTRKEAVALVLAAAGIDPTENGV